MISESSLEMINDMLIPLGFSWDPHIDANREMIDKVCQFHERNGRLPFQNKLSDEETKLAVALTHYRTDKRRNLISEASLEMINDRLIPLGFSWDPLIDANREIIDKVCEFYEMNGRLPAWNKLSDEESKHAKALSRFRIGMRRNTISEAVQEMINDWLIPLGFS